MAVGKVSLEDWLRLTSSLGWTGFFEPSSPPRISIARLAMTSLAFMLVCVPLPVCQTTSGKWSSSLPSMTSSAAWMIAFAFSPASAPRSRLTIAAAFLRMPKARMISRGKRSPPILKWCERALGLGAPVAVGGHLDLAHGVGLGAGLLVVGHRGAMLSRVGERARPPGSLRYPAPPSPPPCPAPCRRARLEVVAFIRAMNSTRISLGQAASHSPWLVQLPKPSASICATIVEHAVVRARAGPAAGASRCDDLGRDEEHRRGVRAGGDAGAAADAGGGVHREVGVVLRDRDRVAVGRAAGAERRRSRRPR